ncbi:MAG: 3-octaprenyl-4-hydroxybenzoate carboxy-lyase [Chloroflexi bacterium RBG_19FT_COMBO_62_14]|nr:MAG: 3-octaprenyl-4-hydroxybenzoate carboxy-lyase [Chloroflexi bacterium RBG_19FT_COMBO_62_14]
MADRIIVSISGASGVIYGIRALEILRELGLETHLILTPAAKVTIAQETDFKVSDVVALASISHDPRDIGASIASGSFDTRGMIVIPCSVKTLSAVANSYADELTARAADVCLKEGRPLVLVVRETPLHPGHIRLMELAAQAGAVIFPPVPSFYGRPQSLDDVITATVGRALARLGVQNTGYPRWEGLS